MGPCLGCWGRQRKRDRAERETEVDLLELICQAASSVQSGMMMEDPIPTDLLPQSGTLLVTMASHWDRGVSQRCGVPYPLWSGLLGDTKILLRLFKTH